MTEHDRAVLHAEGARGSHVLKVAAAEEFRTHHVYQTHPREQQHDAQQPPEIGLHEACENDQQIEHRQARPDFHEALPDQIDPAAIETLQGAGNDADHRADQRQGEGEQDRDTKAVNDSCQYVAPLVVRAEPVLQRGRGRRGHLQLVVDARIVEGNHRPDHPAVLLSDQLLDVRALVVGLQREFAAECRFWITLEHREEPFAVITHDDRLVIGNDFRAEAEPEQGKKDP